MKNGKYYLIMILAALFWSGAFIAGKISTPYVPPFTLTFLRFMVATISLFIFIKITKHSLHRITIDDIPIFLFTGIVGMFGYHIFFFLALKNTSAVNASIIGASNPIITVILSFIFLREKLHFKRLLGIIISITGVFLTITNWNMTTLTSRSIKSGDLLMLLAVVFWASYSVFSRKYSNRYKPIDITFYSFVFCTVSLIPFVIHESPLTHLTTMPAEVLSSILYMGIFASFIGYLIQQVSIKNIGASSTSIFVNLVPVFSMVLSFFILGESLSFQKFLSTAIIVTGVIISQRVSTADIQPSMKSSH